MKQVLTWCVCASWRKALRNVFYDVTMKSVYFGDVLGYLVFTKSLGYNAVEPVPHVRMGVDWIG